MDSPIIRIRFTKSQRIAVFVLISFLFLIELGIWQINQKRNSVRNFFVPTEISALQNQIDASETTKTNFHQSSVPTEKFNPNDLSENDWMNLGFSPKQAAVIIKYKKSLGGKFSSKRELAQCFVISEEKFEELHPYILLPENSSNNSSNNFNYHDSNSSKPKIHYQKFNPNDYDTSDWVKIGFSEKQAATILKYKRSLGGKFSSLDEIEKCFVISEEKFREMKPYMILKVEKPMVIESVEKPVENVLLEKFNPNEYSREQWMNLGFTEKQVNTIFNYKKSLGGKFKDAATLKRCYSISDEKFADIEPYLVFE